MRSSIGCHVGDFYSTVEIAHGPSPLKSRAKPASKVIQDGRSMGVVLRSSIDCHVGDFYSTVEIVYGPSPLESRAKLISKIV